MAGWAVRPGGVVGVEGRGGGEAPAQMPGFALEELEACAESVEVLREVAFLAGEEIKAVVGVEFPRSPAARGVEAVGHQANRVLRFPITDGGAGDAYI